MNMKLWYNHPSAEWLNGLPIGNGRLAAMVCTAAQSDTLSLNHEWLWRAQNRWRDNQPCADHLADVRQCLQQGDFFRATALANTWLGGLGGISQLPGRVDAYQPAVDLSLSLFAADNICFGQRELDINDGVVRISRQIGNSSGAVADITSWVIAHPLDGRIYLYRQSSVPWSGRLSLTRTADPDLQAGLHIAPRRLHYSGVFREGLSFVVQVELNTDGRVVVQDDSLDVLDATELLIAVNLATSVHDIHMEQKSKQSEVNRFVWPDLLTSHRQAFSAEMGRLVIELDQQDSSLPTDERIAALRAGAADETLLLLAAHFGRYLLISASLGGELPANLQGKWNDAIRPPWDSDYHLDINLQMNYWAAEAAGLSACSDKLLRYIERMRLHGQKAARDLYGCRGVWLPIQTDAWGRATPESFGWAVWIGAAPWIAQHFWWHFRYSGDRNFLSQRAYPFFRDIALFYEDYCVADEQGVYQIMPSQSPENRFAGTGLFPVSIGVSTAMDVQLAYDALGYAIRSARLLSVDAADADRWQHIRDHLPPFAIGSDGRLLEWDRACTEVEPGHRHLSHLYGLYPSDLFNPEETPAEYAAAIRALDSRLAQGGGHTGWSRAWVACLSARAGRGEAVHEHLRGLIADFATESLLDLHPPRIFQIDGNLGAAAAVIEALAQYWNERLHLLRALPDTWTTGRVAGLHVPGGHILSFRWQQRELKEIHVTLGYSGILTLSGPGIEKEVLVQGPAGRQVVLHADEAFRVPADNQS